MQKSHSFGRRVESPFSTCTCYVMKTAISRCQILGIGHLVARLAQWIEHRFPKAVVAGSIPAAGGTLLWHT